MLKGNIDRLDAQEISDFLNNKSIKPLVYDVIDSTNLELKRRIQSGDNEYGLIAADKQTMGRGRLGRSFESPERTGIYMSLLLIPDDMDNVLLITSAAAVAVCRAIRKLTDTEPVIKWVNDIYLNGRKICGILAEGTPDKNGKMNIILGIGINVFGGPATFSGKVKDIAGSIYGLEDVGKINRNELVAAVADEFAAIYNNIGSRKFLDDYKRFSMVIGKSVRYCDNGIWYEAEAVDIDDNGGLIVESGGGIRTLSTGEITLRLI